MCCSIDDVRSQKVLKLRQWRCSDAYHLLCQTLDQEADDILQYGLAYLDSFHEEQVIRKEFGSQSDLHRGFYCPSPVYDIFVGNVKRGKLLKNLTKRSANYYVYGFDESDKIIRVEQYRNCKLAVVEHICYIGPDIYGITLDQWGYLYQVTREEYQNNKLVTYSKVLFMHHRGIYDSIKLCRERYIYDEKGLHQCCFTQYMPAAELCDQTLYNFQRKDGKLVSYIASDVIGSEPYEKLSTSLPYCIFIDRNA